MYNHAATRWQHNKFTYMTRIYRIVCITCYWVIRWRSFVFSLLLTALVAFTSLTKSFTVLYVINKPYYGSTYITQVTLLYVQIINQYFQQKCLEKLTGENFTGETYEVFSTFILAEGWKSIKPWLQSWPSAISVLFSTGLVQTSFFFVFFRSMNIFE